MDLLVPFLILVLMVVLLGLGLAWLAGLLLER